MSNFIYEGKCQFEIKSTVFYNPVQEFNRDLSVLVIYSYLLENKMGQPKILDALSASGLRAIRYYKELSQFNPIIYANDLSAMASEQISKNAKLNNISNIEILNIDANILMMSKTRAFDIIDLDPYGSSAPFFASAFNAIKSGGLLCVTCTDMGVLCGATGHRSFGRYGSLALHTKYAHEMSLRIVLNALETHANLYDKIIEPLLCVSIDFYVRLFVRVRKNPSEVHITASKRSLVYHCNSCHTYYMHPLANVVIEKGKKQFKWAHGSNMEKCSICNHNLIIGGPVWNGPLHDSTFVTHLIITLHENNNNCQELKLNTSDRIKGLLQLIKEELNTPLYYKMDKITSVLGMSVPKSTYIKSALLNAGYLVSISHCDPNSIKTNAPPQFIWDIFKTLAKSQNTHPKSTAGTFILSQPINHKINFEEHPNAKPASVKLNLVRFPQLPPNWGPQTKAIITNHKLIDIE